ncbi:hypothetical protein UF75_2484 [Desulfosporosinus sp. I2]|uniref:hypothetical protein n=1 Tax=Desulfosporosinus sp. I2 TaxID=1617025 RepID=UPI0005EF608A|nr:hypothetical protein [Desulfosporosinus sp. I2]KJR47096.1 hypothetical protein UF75_2484 [Desulfosporosinus sp. I2]
MENNRFKPECPLLDKDGNIFNLVGIASRTLKENDLGEKAREMWNRVMESGSYDEALNIIGEYVTIVEDEPKMEDESFHIKME